MLVTTDFSLEGVHFRRAWHPPESVGHRCLARGLSDIAAMGGQPLAAFLSLALPRGIPQKWVDGFLRGLLVLAREHGVELAGGDTAQSPGKGSSAKILADIVVVGSAPRGQAIRRSGAKPGDAIYVTGRLGGSSLVLQKLFAQPYRKLDSKKHPAHFYPEPRLAPGQYLRKHHLASSMIDLSDGLSTDLHHLCEESRVAAEVSAELIPKADGATLEQAIHGGEDYELLFTASASRKMRRSIAGVSLTRIGSIKKGRAEVQLLEGTKRRKLLPMGWEHFRNSP
jgi:thiamine-monophosphate kinase